MGSKKGGIEAGKAYVQAYMEDGPFRRGLKTMRSSLKAFGSKVSSIGQGMLGFGAGIVGAFVPAIKAASDLQETMSKFETVFGARSKDVKEWGDALADSIGRSKGEIAGFLANTQDLLVPLGMSAESAEGMSKEITKLAFDLASFNNMADGDVVRDLHAALTGSGEVMKKYGVIVSEAAVKQELLNQGLDPKTATEAQKAHARFALILKGTTAAQGDAERTAGSFANQMKALQSKVKDTAAEIGMALLPVVTPLIQQVTEAATRFGEWVKEHKDLAVALFKVGAGVTAFGAALYGLGTVISGIGSAVGLLSAVSLPALGVAFAAVGIAAFTYSVYQASEAVRELNRQTAISRGLDKKIDRQQQKRRQAVTSQAASIADPEERKAFLAEEVAKAEREAQGARASAGGAQKRFETTLNDNLGVTGIRALASNGALIDEAEREAEVAAVNADAAEAHVDSLRAMLQAIEREQQLLSAQAEMPTPELPKPSDTGSSGGFQTLWNGAVDKLVDGIEGAAEKIGLITPKLSTGEWLSGLVGGAMEPSDDDDEDKFKIDRSAINSAAVVNSVEGQAAALRATQGFGRITPGEKILADKLDEAVAAINKLAEDAVVLAEGKIT